MPAQVECAACGEKLRERVAQCPMCGSPLPQPAETETATNVACFWCDAQSPREEVNWIWLASVACDLCGGMGRACACTRKAAKCRDCAWRHEIWHAKLTRASTIRFFAVLLAVSILSLEVAALWAQPLLHLIAALLVVFLLAAIEWGRRLDVEARRNLGWFSEQLAEKGWRECAVAQTIVKSMRCRFCAGTGRAPNPPSGICPVCKGNGSIRTERSAGPACPYCGGTGRRSAAHVEQDLVCERCQGIGVLP